jgi:hypothetical protein
MEKFCLEKLVVIKQNFIICTIIIHRLQRSSDVTVQIYPKFSAFYITKVFEPSPVRSMSTVLYGTEYPRAPSCRSVVYRYQKWNRKLCGFIIKMFLAVTHP